MREEALDWLESSLVDLSEAKEAHHRGSYHLAVFLAHQAVEKALKAFIMGFRRIRPPKTHDLIELVTIASIQLDPNEVEALSELSPYYTLARYPNVGLRKPWKEITRGTSQRLLSTAEKVVERIRGLFTCGDSS
ncbi:MAG: HEPN domain-containing protein [Sulfolobales archaeon]